jgi:hypothetical protein
MSKLFALRYGLQHSSLVRRYSDLEKVRNPVRIVIVMAETRNEYLPNTNKTLHLICLMRERSLGRFTVDTLPLPFARLNINISILK